MKYGVIHYNAPGNTVEEFLQWAADTGFDSVELQIGDVWDGESSFEEACKRAEQLRDELQARGLTCSQLAAGNDFIVLDEEQVAFQVERMRKCCELAQILGTNTIRTEGGRPKDEVPPDRWVEAMAGCLKRCVEWAEPMGIRFAVDNHGYVTNEWPIQLQLFEAVGSPCVGANLDTMNYRWFGHDLDKLHEIYKAIAPYTFHTHLKDGFDSRQNYKGQALGEGEIDLLWAVQCLKDAGYSGVWCAEYEGSEDPAIGYRKCLEWMKANL